jgi:hypothetical protein
VALARRLGRRRAARARRGRAPWLRTALEVASGLGLLVALVILALGEAAPAATEPAAAAGVVVVALAVLAVGVAAAALLRGWLVLRPWLAGHGLLLPAVVLAAAGGVALATRPAFVERAERLRAWLGGPAEAQRRTIAHQVYAAYRRSDLAGVLRVLERARVYEPTVHEAAAAFRVDAEVLMGVAAAESSFYPRDSRDGGRGLFQITQPPAEAVAAARERLGVRKLDPLNQRHNAFVAAATLRQYLAEMRGDLFLGLLAYNVGPRNGGLRSIMTQYGAHDFVTIQPYLQLLPRDYPIRVLSAALAYRLWRRDGTLPRYEEGSNARRIQRVGVPGLGRPPGPA